MSTSRKDKLLIGFALKPHGVKGEVRVFSLADNKDVFKTIDSIWFDSQNLKIAKARSTVEHVYLTFENINTRDDAEAIRGELYVDRDKLPRIDKDRYYIVDLIGLDVYIEEEKVGQISQVLNYKANDVVVVSGNRNFMFPFLSKVILKISDEKIVLSKSILEEIAVY
ncbi:MAG: ribosome maturation factor RimM [Christensenellales bacterium]|jgi:16S rRNA processing protein RimM|nr:16S rRNA processing protein RimM [Clostridiales bacterium]